MKGNKELVQFVKKLHAAGQRGIGRTALRAALQDLDLKLSRLTSGPTRDAALDRLAQIKKRAEAHTHIRPTAWNEPELLALATFLEKSPATAVN